MTINNFDFDCLHMKTIKLKDLFNIVSCSESIECKELVPLLGNSSHNNSIIKFVNYYNFEDDYICINAVNPYIGFCSVHHGKFAVQHNVIVLHLKNKWKHLTYCLNCIAGNLTQYLHLKYLRCLMINEQQIIDEVIPRIPFIQDLNNSHKMIIDSEGLKYCFNFWSEGCDSIDKFYNPLMTGLKKFLISELFKKAGKGKNHSYKELPTGTIPIIGNSSSNNGIVKFVNYHDFDGDYITVSSDGSVGYCFAQHGNFAVVDVVNVLQLRYEYKNIESCLTLLAYIMTLYFTKSHNYNDKLYNTRLMKETITLPVVVRGLTPEQEKQINDKLVSISELTDNFTSNKFTYELNPNLINWFCYKWFI